MNNKLYNSYGVHIKQKFGCRVRKISVDAGFTCPNRDGTVAFGGCTFCNNDSFVSPLASPDLSIRDQIEGSKEYLKKRFRVDNFIVYFQAYTNTYANVETLEESYRQALDVQDIVGLSVGTRSDCVDEEKINLLAQIARNFYVTVEYGVESIHDKTLVEINRGHDYQSVVDSIDMTRGKGIYIGAHIILGFPNETEDEMLRTAEEVSKLDIDYLKIHNLHIVKHTVLAKQFENQPFHLFAYDEYLDLICKFLERLSPHIVVERLFAETPPELLIAPKWNKRGNEILRDIEKELEKRITYQGKLFRRTVQV